MSFRRHQVRWPGVVAVGLVVAGLVAACASWSPARIAAADPAASPSSAPAGPGGSSEAPATSPSASPPAAPSPSSTGAPAPKPAATPKGGPTTVKPAPKPTPTRVRTVPTTLASRLHTLPASTRQVVIVHADRYDTTWATLETFTRTPAGWVRAFAPMAVRVGIQGFSDHHVEGVASTPTGVFGFGATMYGINPDPNVKYAYHRIVSGDWWNEASGSSGYNTFQHSSQSPGGASEALWQELVAYRYFAFIKYNVPATAGRGSGIFLHVSKGNATAGCVALSESSLLDVLIWLDPAANPRIVLAPDQELSRF